MTPRHRPGRSPLLFLVPGQDIFGEGICEESFQLKIALTKSLSRKAQLSGSPISGACSPHRNKIGTAPGSLPHTLS